MAVQNTLAPKQKAPFSVMIQQDTYKNLINRTLGDPKKAQRFIASVSSAVAANKVLQECEAGSILSSALLGEALNLSPSPQLGQYYMVPFNDRKSGGKVAQFQLGYKGYIQLALRSGQYKRLNADVVKEGELLRFDPVSETIEIQTIEDERERDQAKTIGYYATFEYLNGFQKTIYWSREKMETHADRYSQAFHLDAFHKLQAGEIPKDELWKYSSFWYKSFDDMALKTMLRQIISKWGIMSTEMQSAIENDMAVIKEDGSREYVEHQDYADVPAEPADPPPGRAKQEDDFFSGSEQ